ncbi:MAG TPA: serine hydrolase domain-containing protein [Edaphobacter sp.]|nr:serine hydrolase domain-containing protein [Edaphobacter sp.]
MRKAGAILLFLIAGVLPGISSTAHADQRSDQVDRLFGRWNTSSTPGMSVAIFRNGKQLYAHSYGMANLELSQPNKATLRYPIGSISKQFAGYCIQLLASEGKLSLSDDVRRYLPEMHNFGEPITLEMLLNHTSGIRDNVMLLLAKGRNVNDVTSEQESFDIIVRQTGLNFRPGTRYRYSNANYVLLAKVVERVSGVPYAAFLQQHIFAPLGMNHTSVVSDPVGVMNNRAYGYSGDKPIVPQTSVDSTYGSTGILSTVGDLAIWSSQFYEPASSSNVLQASVFAQMKKPGILNDGIPITYASGLHVESFHRIPYIEHTGEVPGFKADLLVFPKQKLSIILLANTDTCDATKLAFAMADIYLKNELPSQPSRPQPAASPAHVLLERYAGTYEILSSTSLIAPGRKVHITLDGNSLRYNDERLPLLASSDHDFYSQQGQVRISFLPLKNSSKDWMVVVHDPSGTDFAGRRVEKVSLPALSVAPLPPDAYAGLYYSTDLDTVYTVLVNGKLLSLRTPRGEVPLLLHSGDFYDVKGNLPEGKASGMLEFTRTGSTADGFLLTFSGARAANIKFTRINNESR